MPVLSFPDWENPAYTAFSPHQDIISQRLEKTLHLPAQVDQASRVPMTTLLHRLRRAIFSRLVLMLEAAEADIGACAEPMMQRLSAASTVYEHGDYPVPAPLAWICSPMAAPEPESAIRPVR